MSEEVSVCVKCDYHLPTGNLCENTEKETKFDFVKGIDVPVDGTNEYYYSCYIMNTFGDCKTYKNSLR